MNHNMQVILQLPTSSFFTDKLHSRYSDSRCAEAMNAILLKKKSDYISKLSLYLSYSHLKLLYLLWIWTQRCLFF